MTTETKGLQIQDAGDRFPERRSPLSRRTVLKAATGLIAMPTVISRARAQSKQVVVRTPGGAVGDASLAAIYKPFSAETGIEVIPVPTSVGKLFAMHQSGNMELDMVETSIAQLYDLSNAGALQPIEYKKFKYTNADDIDAADRKENYVSHWHFTTAITYNSKVFRDKHPANWAQFWDAKAFPGKRILQDIASGELPLEFALIADGAPMNALYPLDVDRAFKSLDRIKSNVVAYYSNAASVLQMLNSEEAVMAALWNAQGQSVHDAGGPIAVEMNQSMLASQGLAVVKGAKNSENAQLLLDYSLQPKSQAGLCSRVPYGPSNSKTIPLLDKATLAKLPNSPENAPRVFRRDLIWWHNNRAAMTTRWAQWLGK
ncbi:MAG: ABC transporter substrate-binding protein [Pseudorhodoplanes sp.]